MVGPPTSARLVHNSFYRTPHSQTSAIACSLPPAMQATRRSVTRQTGSAAGGAGGAIYLGLWGTDVFLHNSTFTNNSAQQYGGAVHALAIDSSSVRLHRVNATGNAATLEAEGSDADEFVAATLRSEGGMLHVDGSVASVNISHSVMSNNLAGRVSTRPLWVAAHAASGAWVCSCQGGLSCAILRCEGGGACGLKCLGMSHSLMS